MRVLACRLALALDQRCAFNFPPCPQEHYRIGIYSSASHKTVDTALALLEEAAGRGARHSRQLAAF